MTAIPASDTGPGPDPGPDHGSRPGSGPRYASGPARGRAPGRDPGDGPSPGLGPAPVLERARGLAAVCLSERGAATRLDRLRQEGCAKAFLPRGPGAPQIVFLNTSGGLTGGDRLDYALDLAERATALATTQTAERAYAVPPGAGPATMRVAIDVGADARLDWLPQETILFHGAALERTTEISLGRGATLLACEALVLGRAAMGERVERLALRDRRVVTREGAPVLIEAVELTDGGLAHRDAEAGLAGARAVATLALVAQGAEDAAGPLRALPGRDGVRAAVSGWDGRCLLRLMAADAWPLRLALADAIRHLRGAEAGPIPAAAALPRVWQI